MPTPEVEVPIALLSQTGEASRHLREALAGAGTPIVYEAHAAQLDREALERSGARVVVVNLDADLEAHLDDVYALLGDDRYNVIFNEGQVSAQLAGWEQARWARHLAAKILGTANADPPRPQGAQAVPERAVVQSARPIAPHAAAIDDIVVTSPAAPRAAVETDAAQTPVSAQAQSDYADIARLLAETDGPAAHNLADEFHTDGGATADNAGSDTVDFSEFDIDVLEPTAVEAVADPVPGEITFDADRQPSEPDAAIEGESALGFGDLDDFAGDPGFVSEFDTPAPAGDGGVIAEFDLDALLDEPVAESRDEIYVGADADAAPLDVAAELANSAEAIEAAADGSELDGLELLDLDWADAPAPLVTDDAEVEDVVPPPPVVGSAFAWTLTDVDDPEQDASAATTPAPNDFGIEKISAAEYLAPVVTTDEPTANDGGGLAGLSLELVPLEEAVAPQSTEVRESWLDTNTPTSGLAVRKVWVLGASIGGPEAVRDFLAHIPKDYPALFLLAQHMGAEFMDLMAQQLVKNSKLTVRTPTHGERVAHGDIVIIPTTHRLRVDSEGVIVLEPLGDSVGSNVPSIDQVLHDVADRFGAKSGVIVFSGMAEDAADGARYLAAKGGKVYVQDPRTCVISSMVDGVIETGVVSFTGSPRELAERLLGERSRPTA